MTGWRERFNLHPWSSAAFGAAGKASTSADGGWRASTGASPQRVERLSESIVNGLWSVAETSQRKRVSIWIGTRGVSLIAAACFEGGAPFSRHVNRCPSYTIPMVFDPHRAIQVTILEKLEIRVMPASFTLSEIGRNISSGRIGERLNCYGESSRAPPGEKPGWTVDTSDNRSRGRYGQSRSEGVRFAMTSSGMRRVLKMARFETGRAVVRSRSKVSSSSSCLTAGVSSGVSVVAGRGRRPAQRTRKKRFKTAAFMETPRGRFGNASRMPMFLPVLNQQVEFAALRGPKSKLRTPLGASLAPAGAWVTQFGLKFLF